MTSKYRHKVFTAETPIPETLKDVSLYEDVWEDHILEYHPEMQGLEGEVEDTIRSPGAIFESDTTSGNYVFVSNSVTDPAGRSLRVPVRPTGTARGEVSSAHFSSNVSNYERKLWPVATTTQGKGRK